ncbi:MAG TPA: PEGA domain-containing protein [Polyangiaceae bacterium]|jgi:tetratricopeptide (TPR) repeat protein
MRKARFPFAFSLLLGAWCASAAALPPNKPKPAAPQSAAPAPSMPESPARERARALFDQGAIAYREGRFFEAVEIFSETNRLYPEPALVFNIGKAYEGMGNPSGALRYYREYLRRAPNASDRADVTPRIERFEQALSAKGLQQITVISTPEGATLKLDGQAVGVTPFTCETFAGKHRLELALGGYQATERVIDLDLSRAEDFNVSLEPEPAKQLAPTPPQLPPAEPKIGALTLTSIGSGVALLAASVIAQAAGGTDSSGVSRTAAFFAGGGAGLSALGGVMLYFDLTPTSTAAPDFGTIRSRSAKSGETQANGKRE